MLAKLAVAQRFDVKILVGGLGQTGVTLLDANLTLQVFQNGLRIADPVATLGLTWTEVDAGNAPGVYTAAITPGAAGDLTVFISYTGGTVTPGYWQWDVFTADLSDLSTLLAAYTGASTVTITVEDALAAPIADVAVDVYAADDTTLVVSGLVTDALGQVSVALDDGSYRVHLSKARVTFTVPEVLTVSGATSETYNGVVAPPGTPVSPSLCTVYGTIQDLGGNAIENAAVTASLVSHPTIVSSTGISVESPATVTDSNGYFELTLLRTAVVNLEISAIGLRKQVTIPAAATVEFTTLL